MYTITDALQAHKLELLAKAFGIVASKGTDCHKFIEEAFDRSGYDQDFREGNQVIKSVKLKVCEHPIIIVRIEFDHEGAREVGALYLNVGDDLKLYGEY